jgi:hypothetical protein
MSIVEDDQQDKSRRKPKKADYAFGSPIRQNIVFSDFAHLEPQFVNFAISLAQHTEGENSPRKVHREKSPDESHRKLDMISKKSTITVTDTKLQNSKFMKNSENSTSIEIQEPCTRPECKEVIRLIIETQLKNELEREDILRECEELLLLNDEIEVECVALEDTVKAVTHESNVLEETLTLLNEKLEKYEKKLNSQQQERDELNGKVMALEVEKQRLMRRAKEVETALSEALWSGKATSTKEDKTTPKMLISHIDEKRLKRIDLLDRNLPYHSLVRSDVLDFTERPKSVTHIPEYLLHDKIRLEPISTSGRSDYEVFDEINIRNQTSRKNMHSPISTTRGMTQNRNKRTIGNVSSNTIMTAPIMKNRHHDEDDGVWKRLDPVLYQERARTSWGRSTKLGKIRIRSDPPGFKRVMLTSSGHPGIFDSNETNMQRTAHF